MILEHQAVETAVGARERVLVASRGGRRYAVAEVCAAGAAGASSPATEVFAVSGYFRSQDRAYKRRACLAREDRWLSEETKARMRRGEVLRVEELRWEM